MTFDIQVGDFIYCIWFDDACYYISELEFKQYEITEENISVIKNIITFIQNYSRCKLDVGLDNTLEIIWKLLDKPEYLYMHIYNNITAPEFLLCHFKTKKQFEISVVSDIDLTDTTTESEYTTNKNVPALKTLLHLFKKFWNYQT